MDQNIIQTITVIVLALIAFSAGIWSWWFTNHDSEGEVDSDDKQ